MLLSLVALLAGTSDAAMAAQLKAAPHDIRTIADRWGGCEHWAGEEPYDADSRREIERAIDALKCDRLEGEVRAAKARYRHKPALLHLLNWGIAHSEP